MNKRVRMHASAHESGVSELLEVCNLSRVVNLNVYCELVMIICIERCECGYVSRVVN